MKITSYLTIISALLFVSCDQKNPEDLFKGKYGAAGLKQSCTGPGVTDGSEFFQSQGYGIVNGSRLTPSSRFANRLVLITTKQSQENSAMLCTGVLLPNNVILTAGHCVGTNPKDVVITFTFAEDCSGVRAASRDKKFKADRVIIHPSYNPEDPNSEGNGIESKLKNFNFDLALLRFKGNLPSGYEPLDLPSEDLNVPSIDTFIMMGFGKDEAGSSGQLKITSLPQENLIRYNPNRPSLQFDQSETGICSGDSGGPLLAVQNNDILIVGISSSVKFERGGSQKCDQEAVFVSAGYHATWIKRTYRELLLSKKGI